MAVPLVGLTGGLGAGKSTALAELASLGAAVLSADAVVHELYETETVRDAVRERFGGAVLDGERVDRAALATRVFENEDDRVWLEQFLWPLVRQRAEQFYAEACRREQPPRAAVIEAPLLFEAGGDAAYTATIAVVADDALRASRIAARDQAQLARREERQLPQPEKARRATYTVVNDGSVAELREQLSGVLEKICR
jgi:dephospho-CoA kinase